MNRAEKAVVIDEITANITDASAIFAVDYRGITVEQARDLRARLRASDATFRVVKNSLTERAADAAGVEQLKPLLAGPTALTFVRGDSAAAAKSLADFARTTQLLAFKGGLLDGAPVSPAEITMISRLPSRDVLYGQLVSLVANPISGLARTLGALVSNLAVGLGQVLDQKKASDPAPAETPPAETPPAETPPAEAPPAEAPPAEAPPAEAPPAEPAAAEPPAAEPPAAEADEPTGEAPTDGPAGASSAEEESPQASSDDITASESEEESPQASSDDASSDD